MEIDPNLMAAIFGLVGAGIGGLTSFLVQKWHFKKSLKKQVIEEVYHPIIYDLENDISYQINNLQNTLSTKWEGISRNSKDMWVPEELRQKLAHFFNIQLKSYDIDITFCNTLITNAIQKDVIEANRDKGITITQGSLLTRGFINTILRFDPETGEYLGNTMPEIPTIEFAFSSFEDIKAHTPTQADLLREMAEKIKNSEIVKKVKLTRLSLIKEINELTEELKKNAKL